MALLLVCVVVLIVAILVIYVAMRPDEFRIERSIVIKAAPEKIFALVNDFHQWEAWSPWEKIDPEIKRSYSGAEQGVGAIYEWSGNKNIGQGYMEITQATPFSNISINLNFIKPFKAHNFVNFTFTQQGDSTALTQTMRGPSSFFSKLIRVFFNMEKMVGGKYEQGLTSIKTIAENA